MEYGYKITLDIYIFNKDNIQDSRYCFCILNEPYYEIFNKYAIKQCNIYEYIKNHITCKEEKYGTKTKNITL